MPRCTAMIKRLIALCLLAVLAAGCTENAQFTWSNAGGVPVQTAAAQPKALELTVFMPPQSGLLNPLINRSREMRSLMGLVYEGLLRFDAEQKPAPCLAESWVAEEDNVVLLTLRKDITFSDGKPLTARDVDATLTAIKEAGSMGVYGYILPYIRNWEVVSERELRVRGSVAEPLLAYALTFPVLPESADMTAGGLPGTGPMQVVQYIEGGALEMVRNTEWWREMPTISSITAIALSDDIAAVNAFAMERLDMLSTRRPNATQTLSPDRYRSYVVSTRRFEFLALNLQDPELGDIRMRAAIRQAIDRKDIIDSVYLGHAVVADLPVAPGSALSDPRLATAEYAPEEALAALRGMGFTYDEQSGVLLRKRVVEGDMLDADAEVRYKLIFNEDLDNNERRETATRIAAGLKKIGIALELVELKYTDYEKALRDGDYDMALAGCELSPVPDLAFCYGSGVTEGANVTFYASDDMDRLLAATRTAEDMEALREAMYAVEACAAADLPFIGLFFRTATLLCRPEITGMGSLHEDNLYGNIGEWGVQMR